MSALEIHDVFVPNGNPEHTYVRRNNGEYESKLKGILRKGKIAFVYGPSKCGKSVLCRQIAGSWGSDLITMNSRNYDASDAFFEDLALKLGIPDHSVTQVTKTEGSRVTWSALIKASIFGLGEAGLTGASENSSAETLSVSEAHSTYRISAIAQMKKVFVFDNFHYIKDDRVKREILNELRDMSEAHRLGIVVIAITDRPDYLTTLSAELLGRCEPVTLPKWRTDELYAIPRVGFEMLGVRDNPYIYQELTKQCFGSPALMQSICLELGLHLKVGTPEQGRRLYYDQLEHDLPGVYQKVTEAFIMTTVYHSLISMVADSKLNRKVTLKSDPLHNRPDEDSVVSIFEAVIHLLAHTDEPTSLDNLRKLYKEHVLEPDFSVDDRDWVRLLGELAAASDLLLDDEDTRDAIESTIIVWKEKRKKIEFQNAFFAFFVRWSGYVSESN